MLFIIQFPIADSRRLVGDETAVLPLPTWPRPRADEQFIRSFGPILNRTKGGMPVYGESKICRANRAIRFKSLSSFKDNDNHCYANIKGAFRRFYFDGVTMGKYEVGLNIVPSKYTSYSIPEGSVEKLISHILNCNVNIPTPNAAKGGYPLIDSGKYIAKHFMVSSSNTASDPLQRQNWWVRPGTPLILAKYNKNELEKLPFKTTVVSGPFAEFGIELFYSRIAFGQRKFPMWFVAHNSGSDMKKVRFLRMCLLRQHAEREVLDCILTNIKTERININDNILVSDAIQRYLNNATRRINKLEKTSKDSFGENFIELVKETEDLTIIGDRDSLLEQLEGVRENVLNKIKVYTKKETSKIIHYHNHMGEVLKVSETNYFSGNFFNNTVSGDVVQTFNNSFNQAMQSSAPEELKAKIKELKKLIEEFSHEDGVDKQTAETVARDFSDLAAETTSPKPRKSRIQVTADGLIDAAKTCAKLAAPITSAVKSILLLLAV